jgi:hypothetical protein
MVCHQFTCKIGRVIYALKCVKHETNADAASNCFSKLCRVLNTAALLAAVTAVQYLAGVVGYRLMVK